MREIKFRMWDFENGQMVDGDSLAFEEYAPIKHLLSQKGIMQYTGLIDRNGKEIYEGDILKTTHQRYTPVDNPFTQQDSEIYEKSGVLEYYLGYQMGYRIKWKKGHLMINGGMMIGNMKGEVIGNIYENPELIEVSA